jgi:hypothetical protein
MARDAASLRPPPGTVNGKVVVFAFFCATAYFAHAFTTNNINKGGDLKNSSLRGDDGKRRGGNGEEEKKAKWYLPSNR